MADGRTHVRVGKLAGAGTAAVCAMGQTPGKWAAETAGGYLGGWLGAKLPDVIDPPTCGHHRSLGHGIAPCTAVATHFVRALPGLQMSLRQASTHYSTLAASTTEPMARVWYSLLAWLCTLGAGALAGVLGGYVSHLALDCVTPAGLPLIA